MIVSCPNCSTNFKVPEAALGRSVKCARCGHVWKASAAAPSPAPAGKPAPAPVPAAKPAPARIPSPAVAAFDEEEIPLESPPTRSAKPKPEPDFDDFPADDPALAEMNALGFTGEGGDPFQEDDAEDPFSKMSDLMRARQPESMPDIFSPPKPKKPLPRRPGAFILWVMLILLVLSGVACALYFFQDKVIDHWPSLAKYYEQVGARRDEVGAGLSFRNYNSERLVQDNNEVLIVRGVIANGTEQKHDIPLLRLALYKGTEMLQEKVVSPPQATLDGHATVGFKVTLEQPHPEATRFEVTFIAAKAAGK